MRFLLRKPPEQLLVRRKHPVLEVRKALIQCPAYQRFAVEGKAVEDEVGGAEAGGEVVEDEFAVDQGVGVEGGEGRVVFEWEVEVGDVPVVVAAVDEEVGFGAGVGVCGAVEEVALAVGLFTDVVTTSTPPLASCPISISPIPVNWKRRRGGGTHSCFINSPICFLEKLTGCAPGNPFWLLPSSLATSSRSGRASSSLSFSPGAEMSMSFACAMVALPLSSLCREARAVRFGGLLGL